jgi:hypothetical protein
LSFVNLFSISERALGNSRERWVTITKAALMSAGIAVKNSFNASCPPADAPTPII